MNRGALAGLIPTTWKTYKPQVLAVGQNADQSGLTQPFFDTTGGKFQFGRYMRLNDLIVVQIQTSGVGVNTTWGVGDAYVWSLPIPARRAVPGVASLLPIGEAMCYISTTEPYPNVPCAATLADPWPSLNGTQDNYLQLYATQCTSWGSETAWTSTSARTVTHYLGRTPLASDITVTSTAYAGSGNTNPWYVDTIGGSTFAVHTWSDISMTAGAGAFSWKIIAEPLTGQGGNLVGPFVPFNWAARTSFLAPFGNIFIELAYEPAR